MNKLKVTIAGLLVACLGIGVVSAQTSTPSTPAKTSTTAAASTPAKPATQHLKKDGTPDKRYKENKTAKSSTTAPAAKKSTGTKKAAATTTTTPAAK